VVVDVWEDLRNTEPYLQLRDQGKSETEAIALTTGLYLSPEEVDRSIAYFSADNLSLHAHVCVDDELRGKLAGIAPGLKPECYDIPLGDWKYVFIAALVLLRNRLAADKALAA
jgi:hypothetical protein